MRIRNDKESPIREEKLALKWINLQIAKRALQLLQYGRMYIKMEKTIDVIGRKRGTLEKKKWETGQHWFQL